MLVEFIYDRDCPNVASTRSNLLRAFAKAKLPAKWTEWERSSPDVPAYAREFGSPAILVNGRDIAGLSPGPAAACRIYNRPGGLPTGTPSVELIPQALSSWQQESVGASNGAGVKEHLPLVPAVLFALLPKVACPACWPAYVGLLSALGLGFIATAEFLLPLTALFLLIVLVGLALAARKRRGFGPLLIGVVASTAILLGKFTLNSDFLFYTGPGIAGRFIPLEHVAAKTIQN